jgi:hypothetical protein
MSSEGVTLIARASLIVALTVAASVFRALIGPGERRGRIMLVGTIGGISLGALAASAIARWIHTDVSVICASVGVVLGWTVSWIVARHLPREAH